MNSGKTITTRRKVLLLGSLFLSGLAFFSTSLIGRKANKKVKMLTERGELVEIETSRIPASKKKASKQQLQSWIKR